MKKSEKIKKKAEQESSETTGTESVVTSRPTSTADVVHEVKKIGTLDVDFGRGDLNLMRDKLNEVINKSNGN